MKTISTLITLIVFAHFGFSQPVISNVVPNFGDQMVHNEAESAPDAGASGANITWDFSDFVVNEYTATSNAVHPNEVEYSDLFPDATMAWSVDVEVGGYSHFLSFGNDQLTNYGTAFSYMGSFIGVVLDNPMIMFNYPLNYQDTGNDTYSGITTTPAADSPLTAETSYVVDGYGTIHTPYGTYENVLRVTTTGVSHITTFGIESTTTSTASSWYSPDYPVMVYSLGTSVVTQGSITDTSYSSSALVSYTGATGIDKIDATAILTIYPNPASEYIVLDAEVKDKAELKIYGSDGKLVMDRLIHTRDKIDVNNLSPGYYIAMLMAEGTQYKPVSFVVY